MSRAPGLLVAVAVAGCATSHARVAVPDVIDDGSGIPVAVSPAALLAPGGVRALSSALAERHLLPRARVGDQLDADVEKAIATLQRREEMPVTGLPTYATVAALGLSPEKVFRPVAGAAAGR